MRNVLDSRQMLAFATVARQASFTLAAKELFLTQSAVSHALKSLEEELGCRLLDRVGKRVLLTQAGEQFLLHTEKILREMEVARGGLDALAQWGQGRLRLGASTTACQYILPAVLREFKQSFPRCTLKIEPGDQSEQFRLLNTYQVDLSLMLEPEVESEFNFIPLFDDELSFVVTPTHPWAVAGRVIRESLGTETLVLYNKTSYTYRLVESYFRGEKTVLTNCIELGSMDAIKELVKLGLGAGILASWVAREELESGELISFPLGPRKLSRRWGIVHLRGRRLPLAEETFVELCRKATASFNRKGA